MGGERGWNLRRERVELEEREDGIGGERRWGNWRREEGVGGEEG